MEYDNFLELASDQLYEDFVTDYSRYSDGDDTREDYFNATHKYWEKRLKEEKQLANFFTEEFLDEIGYKLVTFERGCGKAVDKRTNGYSYIYWNLEGISMTYFGEPLEPNIAFGVRLDGDTRYAFNGHVYTAEDVKRIVKLVR